MQTYSSQLYGKEITNVFSKYTRLTSIFFPVDLNAIKVYFVLINLHETLFQWCLISLLSKKKIFQQPCEGTECRGTNYCPIVQVAQGYQSDTTLTSSLETINILCTHISCILQSKVHMDSYKFTFSWFICVKRDYTLQLCSHIWDDKSYTKGTDIHWQTYKANLWQVHLFQYALQHQESWLPCPIFHKWT